MMRIPAPAERLVWGLVRACLASGGWQARAAEALADVIKPPPLAAPPQSTQSTLWVVDADGLPPRPWRVEPLDTVSCVALHCEVAAHVCVARQIASDVQRTRQSSRGQGFDYPSCVTERCAQGRGIRAALSPDAQSAWHGEGRGGRLAPRRSDLSQQHTARQRLAAVGLLDLTPSVDEPPAEVELEGGDER
jgi:hypothetical protein